MTIKSIIKQLNDEHCHPAGYHLSMLRMDLMPEDLADVETDHNFREQTYPQYWNPEKDGFVVTLSDEDVKYISNALEVYNGIMSELHVEPKLKELIEKMGGTLC